MNCVDLKFLPRFLFGFTLLAMSVLFSECKPEDETPPYVTVLLRLTHKVEDQILEFNQKKYTNLLGQSYSISKLNYFISNIKLRNKESGAVYFESNSYHLIKPAQNPGNIEITLLNVPKGKYTQMEFSVGVDNGVNHSTDQIGDVDVGNGMAWGWEAGYKFLELEGEYTTSLKTGPYIFHIGEDPNYKSYTFDFKNVTGGAFDLVKSGQILVDANLNACFGNPNPVDFNILNNIHSISTGSSKIADNYGSSMFTLTGAQ